MTRMSEAGKGVSATSGQLCGELGGLNFPLGKHTSVTKEASRAMKDLKTKRKALDERTQRRASQIDHDPMTARLMSF